VLRDELVQKKQYVPLATTQQGDLWPVALSAHLVHSDLRKRACSGFFFAPPGSIFLSVQKIFCLWKGSVVFTEHKVQEENVLSRQLWQTGT